MIPILKIVNKSIQYMAIAKETCESLENALAKTL